MNIELLLTLSASDQRTFLLGGIASELTSLESALRQVHSALRSRRDREAFGEAPAFLTSIIRTCRELAKTNSELDDSTRVHVRRALTLAAKAYTRRNHAQRALLDEEFELHGVGRETREGADPFGVVSWEELSHVGVDLVAAKDQLRHCVVLLHGVSSQSETPG